MHIENKIDVFGSAPLHEVIEQVKTFSVIARKELVMDWNADGVKARLMDQVDIIASDIGIAPGVPKSSGPFSADQFGHESLESLVRIAYGRRTATCIPQAPSNCPG
jgi:hypothetical protein